MAALAFGAVALLTSAPGAQDGIPAHIYTKTDLKDIVQRVDRRSDDFKHTFDKALDHSILDGSKQEDRLKKRAGELHEALKKLRHDFKDGDDYRKLQDRVDRSLSIAADINRVMIEHRFTRDVERSWDLLRTELNALAMVYDLRPLEVSPI